jgi:hypothetical protein
MLRNHFIINLLLLILIVFLGVKTYEVITYSVEMPSVPEAVDVPLKSTSIAPNIRLQNESAFNDISDKNIFNPSRSPVKTVTGGPVTQTSSKEVPKLFGTIIVGNRKSAVLQDTVTKITRTYKVNDEVGDFVVTDIMQDVVVLSRGGEVIEIKLREDKGSAPVTRSRNRQSVPKLRQKPPVPPER